MSDGVSGAMQMTKRRCSPFVRRMLRRLVIAVAVMATPVIVFIILSQEEMWRHDRYLDRMLEWLPATIEAQGGPITIRAISGQITGDPGSGFYCSYYAKITVLTTFDQEKIDAIIESVEGNKFEVAYPGVDADWILVDASGEAPYLTVLVADRGHDGMLDPRCG